MVEAYLFANGGQILSLRWLALFRNFKDAREANWGHACLAYFYSVMDTLSRGTLCQLAGPWKLFEVGFSRFTFLYIVLQIALCTLANHICALHLNCYSELANFISYSCKLYMCSVSCKLYMCSCSLQTVPNLQTIYVLCFLQTVSIFFFCNNRPWPMPYLLMGLMWTWRPLPRCESILMALPLTQWAKLSSFFFCHNHLCVFGFFFWQNMLCKSLVDLGLGFLSLLPQTWRRLLLSLLKLLGYSRVLA